MSVTVLEIETFTATPALVLSNLRGKQQAIEYRDSEGRTVQVGTASSFEVKKRGDRMALVFLAEIEPTEERKIGDPSIQLYVGNHPVK